MSMNAIVRHYVRHFRPRAERELAWFRSQADLAQAIHVACMAADERGRRYSHQTRRKQATLFSASERLARVHDRIGASTTFARLHKQICSSLEYLSDAGPLYKYDTALRIGAFLGLKPDAVYLHLGTANGAQALGLDPKVKSLVRSDLPDEFQDLAFHEVEDVLCIYKHVLEGAQAGRAVDLPDDAACFPDEDTD